MTNIQRTPKVDAIRVGSKRLDPSVAESVSTIQVDRSEATVGEVTVEFVTAAALRSPLGKPEQAVTVDGDPLSVANVAAEFGAVVLPTIRLRSQVMRRMIAASKASVEKNTSPSEWVARRVKKAGGRAITQQTTKRKQIGQKGGKDAETDLDVLQRLADDVGFSWVEQDGVVVFGARSWAVDKRPRGSRRIATTSPGYISGSFELTPDSDTDVATGSLTLAQQVAATVKLWEVVTLDGFSIFDGRWLVTGVQGTRDDASDWSIDLAKPRKRGANRSA